MNASPRDVPAGSDPLPQFSTSRDFALDCDAADILAPYRKQFELPISASGEPLVYLCGHSLGLAPRAALDYVSEELADWPHSVSADITRRRGRGSTTRRISPRACST
jgi:kynureninase